MRNRFALLVSLLVPLGLGAAPKWHTLQAPHCLIVSQLSERETRAWATEFEQFTSTLRQKILVNEAFLPPLTVVLFSDTRQFDPYRPVGPDGKKRDIAGVFASRDTWGAIGLAESFSNEATRRVVLHEATHWLLSATRTEMPLWLNEGFAEVFSTFQAKKGYGLLGDPIPYHVSTLRGKTWVPLLQLMLTSHGDRLYTDTRLNDVFYAESWIFAHRLLFEDPAKGHEILNHFFADRLRGTGQLESLQSAFGQNIETIQDNLESYIRDGRFTFTKILFADVAPVGAPFEAASPTTVENALARLAVGAQRYDRARTHITRASELDPADPIPHELLALIASGSNDTAGAETEAARALELGSNDAWMHCLVARNLWRHQADRGTLDAAAREIADHFARAIELQPKLRYAYADYAAIAPVLPSVTQDDATILARGYKTFPDAPEILVGIAAILQKGHNLTEASRVLDMALSRPELLTQQQRSDAEALRTRWTIEPHRVKLDAFLAEKAYPEALAELDAILALPMRFEQRAPFERRRPDLLVRATMAKAEAAARLGQPGTAIALLDTLLASSDLDRRQRGQIEKIRDNLDRTREAFERSDRARRIDTLCSEGRFAEAIAEYDAWLAEPLDPAEQRRLGKAREQAVLAAALDTVRLAEEAGRYDEALAIISRIRSEHFLDDDFAAIVENADLRLRRLRTRAASH